MDEHQTKRPPPPVLRSHRLLPGETGILSSGGPPIEGVAQAGESWLGAPHEASSFPLAEDRLALAERTWLSIEKAALTLATLPTLLQTTVAPVEALQQVALLSSLLLTLPQQMATGLETSPARVDRLFSRLLNAPRRSGLIEQVIDALALSSTADEQPTRHDIQIEVLRQLHRDLVTLQQAWDTVLRTTSIPEVPTLASPLPTSTRQAEPVGPPPASLPSGPLSHPSMPLPAWGVVVRSSSGGAPPRSSRLRPVSRQQPRLALVLAALVLVVVITGTWVGLLQGRVPPEISTPDTASSGDQRTPLATSSPTPLSPSPSPQPSPTAQPTQHDWLCPSGSAFCVSTLQVHVSCSRDGSAAFQLLNNSARKVNWQTLFTPGPEGIQVTISPSAGKLKLAQQVTLTVQATHQGQVPLGTIKIVGPDGTTPITVAVQGCG